MPSPGNYNDGDDDDYKFQIYVVYSLYAHGREHIKERVLFSIAAKVSRVRVSSVKFLTLNFMRAIAKFYYNLIDDLAASQAGESNGKQRNPK